MIADLACEIFKLYSLHFQRFNTHLTSIWVHVLPCAVQNVVFVEDAVNEAWALCIKYIDLLYMYVR